MKKKCLSVIACLAITSNLFAYNVGDTIDDETAKALNIESGVAVIDFFAAWCISCKKELPLMQKISESLSSSGIKIIGVDTDEDKSEGIAFQKELGLKFSIYNDTKQEIVSKFEPVGMPAIYYIKDKKVVKTLFGAVDNIDNVVLNDLKGIK
jgi:cytochrome c biogenesis protein CcmG, thiol:disulfide interchange protein DsbE